MDETSKMPTAVRIKSVQIHKQFLEYVDIDYCFHNHDSWEKILDYSIEYIDNE